MGLQKGGAIDCLNEQHDDQQGKGVRKERNRQVADPGLYNQAGKAVDADIQPHNVGKIGGRKEEHFPQGEIDQKKNAENVGHSPDSVQRAFLTVLKISGDKSKSGYIGVSTAGVSVMREMGGHEFISFFGYCMECSAA